MSETASKSSVPVGYPVEMGLTQVSQGIMASDSPFAIQGTYPQYPQPIGATVSVLGKWLWKHDGIND
jgi:hypothetical protein